MTDSTALLFVRSLIPQYPGYADEDARLQTDRLVRAWVGSCFASVRERLAHELDPALSESLDALIFRCQFPDQRYIAALEHALLQPDVQERLIGLDRKVLELAQGSCAVDVAGLADIISRVEATFEERTPVSA